MIVAPIYSKKERKVYHNNNRCTERNNIETINIVKGTGNLPLCSRCVEWNNKTKVRK